MGNLVRDFALIPHHTAVLLLSRMAVDSVEVPTIDNPLTSPARRNRRQRV